jgi:hypothetical protein
MRCPIGGGGQDVLDIVPLEALESYAVDVPRDPAELDR